MLAAVLILCTAGAALAEGVAPGQTAPGQPQRVVSGEDADGGPTADYNGTTVHFCCDNCKAKWDRWDDAAKKAAVAKLK